jgi:hypothetical protein
MSFITDNQIIVLTAPQVERLIVDAYKKGHEEAVSEMDKRKSSINWEDVPNYLSVPQAGKLSNEHPTTIKRKCDEGLIGHVSTPTEKRMKLKIPKMYLKKYIENKR